MYKNYYLFRAQINWLTKKISNYTIIDSFTYKKSELVLHIKNDEEFYLRICVSSSQPYILLSRFKNIRSSKVNLFNQLKLQKIKSIRIDESDKIVFLETGSYQLKVFLYGKTPNILLYNAEENEISRFKKEFIEQDKTNLNKRLNPISLTPDKLNQVILSSKEVTIIKFLSSNIVGFNFFLSRECCFRCKISTEILISDINDSEISKLCISINQLIHEFEDSTPIIYYANGIPRHLSIIIMKHLEGKLDSNIFNSLNDAWDTFIWQNEKSNRIDKTINHCNSVLSNRIEFLKKSLQKIKEFEKLEERKKLSEIKGNLLLTFLNSIPRGAKSVKLENIFTQKRELIEIKLNPAKSIQENAQKYFDKFKNMDVQQERMVNRKNALNLELTELMKIKNKFADITSLKEALKFKELLIHKNLIQTTESERKKDKIPEHKFRKIMIEDKWNVFIGKNNLDNDLLTFSFAHKYDWWFHAQGIPGSHTIIHLNNKKELPPMDIIEKVASLAAYHSSDKHSQSVPVIYTQVRYVRRIKKAKPGTVSVLQHKTIFVEPKDL